jgi:hypothetical protein
LIITVPKASSSAGPMNPNRYPLYDRNYGFVKRKDGSSADGYGAMRTELHVYPDGMLPAQTRPAGLYVRNNEQWTETWAPGTEPV